MGLPALPPKFYSHRELQGLAQGKRGQSKGLLSIHGSYVGPGYTHHWFFRPTQRSGRGKRADLNSKVHLTWPIHFQRCKLRPREVRHLPTVTQQQAPQCRSQEQGLCIARHTAHQASKESWQVGRSTSATPSQFKSKIPFNETKNLTAPASLKDPKGSQGRQTWVGITIRLCFL